MLVETAYGKSSVRLVKVSRHGDRHDLKDLTIAGASTYAFATLIIFTTSNIAAFATEIGDQKQA